MGFLERWAGTLGAGIALVLLMVVASIMFKGEDLEARDKRGRTPLIAAAEQGDGERVWDLLARGARVEAEDDCRWTALMRAASNGHLELVQRLIGEGASVDHQGKIGFTALMAAAINGHHETAGLLVEHGADRSLRESETGKTALQLAIMNDDKRMIEFFLNADGN